MEWKTELTELLGIRYPIMQGALAIIGTADLAAPVSEAGGLGTITAWTLRTPEKLRDEIRKALAKMSPKAAETFVLRYFEGYGNHEIARMLGTSRSTINVILHRTRQKLREEIASYVGEIS